MSNRVKGRYYTLVTRDGPTDRWAIQFGDYERETVEAERAEYRDKGVRATNLRIFHTSTAHIGPINKVVGFLNGE